jgi:hypothetical protein
MIRESRRTRSGLLVCEGYVQHPERVRIKAERFEIHEGSGLIRAWHRNIYVNTGLTNALLREFGQAGGNPVGFMGITGNNSGVNAGTTNLGGTPIIKALTTNTIAGQTVTAGTVFNNTDGSQAFAWTKCGLLTTATDAGTGLVDVVGGNGNRPFTIDVTGGGTYNVNLQILVTAIAI